MRTVSDGFLEAIRYPHTVVHRVRLYPSTGGTHTLEVDTGSVTMDRTASTRRTATLDVTLRDADTGESLNSATAAALVPFGAEVKIERGIQYPDQTIEYVTLGMYRLDDVDVNITQPGASLTLSDRSAQIADSQVLHPKRFRGTALIEDAIAELITDVYPAASVTKPGASDTFGKTTIVDQDRWQACQDWATAIGCEVYSDADGDWQIAAIPDPAISPIVWEIDAGITGVLVDAHIKTSRSDVKNTVVVTGRPLDNHAPVRVVIKDLEPTSPTYALGPYGVIPDFLQSDLIRTTGQGTAAGIARLTDLLGEAKSVSFAAVPNPALEAGDCVTITYPDGTSETHIIDQLTIGLGVDGEFTGETRSTTA